MSGYLTKIEMARVVVEALLNMKQTPAWDHPRVLRVAKQRLATVQRQYALAVEILQDREAA